MPGILKAQLPRSSHGSNYDADAQHNGQSKQIIFLCLYAMTYMSVQ